MRTETKEKLDLSEFIRKGDGIVIGQGTGEPQTITELLVEQRSSLRPLTTFVGSAVFSQTFTSDNSDGLNLLGYGAVARARELIKSGKMAYIPMHIGQLPAYLGGIIRCDVAMIQVCPAVGGAYGYSLLSDYSIDAVQKARVVIAEVNCRAPRTNCAHVLKPEQIHVLVESDRPLLSVPRSEVGDVDRQIAKNVAKFIKDGATLQIGPGAIPEAILAMLADRVDLGLHTGVIGDAVLDLISKGVLTNARKEVDAGVSVTGALWGTDRLYSHAHGNKAIRMETLSYTHSSERLAKFQNFVSVNSALEVDLTGQVNAEAIGGEYFGAVGGQVDFVRAGARSDRGASIIALPSMTRDGRASKIVSRLSGPVTTARCEVDVIATEHGAVRLRGMSLHDRVKAMLSIADPRWRESLEKDARSQFLSR